AVGHYLQFAVAVLAEPLSGVYTVLVNDPQHAEPHVPRVVIVGEGECVIGVEPTVVGVAALVRSSNSHHLSSSQKRVSRLRIPPRGETLTRENPSPARGDNHPSPPIPL